MTGRHDPRTHVKLISCFASLCTLNLLMRGRPVTAQAIVPDSRRILAAIIEIAYVKSSPALTD
jgi:hypothetical protein